MNRLFTFSGVASMVMGGLMACTPMVAKAIDFDETGVYGDIKYGIVGTAPDYEAYVIEFDWFEDDDMEYRDDVVIPARFELNNGAEAVVVGIDERAFYSSAVTSVSIPNTVRTIGKQAFGLCSSLTSVKIGSGIEEIGSKAFFPDAKLKTMFVDALTPPVIASDALMNAPESMKLFVPAEAVDAYMEADVWKTIGSILSQDNQVLVTKIEINPSSVNVAEFTRLQLSATVYPADAEQNVSWLSSNTMIATVSVDGEVYANKSGICTIYACATDGSGVRGECILTVGSGKILELSRPYITGYVGDSSMIEATVSPDDTSVEWSIADPGIATITSEGLSAKVNLIGVGETVLTATASNGLSKESEVIVNEEIKLSAIEVDPEKLELEVGDCFYMYEFDVIPVPEDVSDFNPNFYIEDRDIVDYDEFDIDGETFICLAPGITRLVWKQGDIEGYCTIIVRGEDEVLLTDISLDPSEVKGDYKIGDTIQIVATPVPANATYFNPEWSSSNEEVATVDENGLVTVMDVNSSATITCKSGNIKATCQLSFTNTGISEVERQANKYRVVSIEGLVISESASAEEVASLLPGVYIINGKKTMIRSEFRQ